MRLCIITFTVWGWKESLWKVGGFWVSHRQIQILAQFVTGSPRQKSCLSRSSCMWRSVPKKKSDVARGSYLKWCSAWPWLCSGCVTGVSLLFGGTWYRRIEVKINKLMNEWMKQKLSMFSVCLVSSRGLQKSTAPLGLFVRKKKKEKKTNLTHRQTENLNDKSIIKGGERPV